MWNRLREIYRRWWPVAGLGVLGGYSCWLGFDALATGVYRWRGRTILATVDPISFRDGVTLSLIFGFGLFAYVALMLWCAAKGLDSKERVEAYFAKRRSKARDETVA